MNFSISVFFYFAPVCVGFGGRPRTISIKLRNGFRNNVRQVSEWVEWYVRARIVFLLELHKGPVRI